MEHSIDDTHIPNPAFDPLDPHGATHADHGHHIASAGLLMGTLLALLFFTVLTVFLSRGEVWFQDTFSVVLPQWVNVLIAMSIAVVKASLVVAFFMGLRYDKPLNLFVLLFCLAATVQFLLPTTLDLYSRDWVTNEHKGEIILGGTGAGLDMTTEGGLFVKASPRPNTGGEPLFEFRRQQSIDERASAIAAAHGHAAASPEDMTQARHDFWVYHYDHELHDTGHTRRHPDDLENVFASWSVTRASHGADSAESVARAELADVTSSSENHSVRHTGRTLGLFDEHAPGTDTHADDASGHGEDH